MSDETKCDACGQPTPRLDPPAETELCDACWRAAEHDSEIRAQNDATYTALVSHWFRAADPAVSREPQQEEQSASGSPEDAK